MKDRKRNRMQNFDYSKDAIYFITACCKNRIHHFGNIIDGEMNLNEYGEIAKNQMEWLAEQYPYIKLHNYAIMPNHIHILIEINRDLVRAGRDLPQPRDLPLARDLPQPIKIKSISSIMGAYKTTTSKQIHLLGNQEFAWQRSFHDHIVRNEKRYYNIFNYITDNPKRWKGDTFNTQTNPNFEADE